MPQTTARPINGENRPTNPVNAAPTPAVTHDESGTRRQNRQDVDTGTLREHSLTRVISTLMTRCAIHHADEGDEVLV